MWDEGDYCSDKVAYLRPAGLRWVIMYKSPSGIPFETDFRFWSKTKADAFVQALNCAYHDGIDKMLS